MLVDDASHDDTVGSRATCRARPHRRPRPRTCGYGANQKTCYREALAAGADIVIMVHPDYQYTPKLIPAMASMIAHGLYHVRARLADPRRARASATACRGGNTSPIACSPCSRTCCWARSCRSTTPATAPSRGELLERLPLEANSDDFVFDNQMLAQVLWLGCTVAEVSCPTKYFAEASSINFARSVRYGFGCLATAVAFRLARMGVAHSRLFRRH